MGQDAVATPASFADASQLLSTFSLNRILSQGTAVPDGTNEKVTTILKIEKTAYAPNDVESLLSVNAWDKLETVTSNSIYGTFLGWTSKKVGGADVQLTSICPATEKHIKKYSQQVTRVVKETPKLYETVVEPYISSLPSKQISWVYNILDGSAEAENVIFRDDNSETGFVLTPDLKWDQKTMSALYLLVLVQTREIRSLRDLKAKHLQLLKNIRSESEKAAIQRYGIDKGELRFFVHYQPTYYHFHVHVTHLNYEGFPGITVGQSHLLDDLIDLLELGVDFASRTFTYALGVEHSLYNLLQ